MEQIKIATKFYKLAMNHKFIFGVSLCAVITVLYYLISTWVINDETYVVDIIPQENIKDGAEFAAGLMSALALAFVVFSIFIQHEELILQRNELEGQKKEVEKQNKILKIQQFENTFFHLLKVYSEKINKVGSNNYKEKTFGLNFMERSFEITPGGFLGKDWDATKFEKFQYCSHQYKEEFKAFYSLLYYVSVTDVLSELDKKTYISILINQLSLVEKAWLFFFALDNIKLKSLIEKHGIFYELKEEINDGGAQYHFMLNYLNIYKQSAYELY